MKKVKLFGLEIKELVNEYDGSILVEDFKKSGVYCIESGCRGEVESIEFIGVDSEIVVKEKDDIIKELIEDISVEEVEESIEYFNEFCDGYFEGVCYVELLGEESCKVYVNVIVE